MMEEGRFEELSKKELSRLDKERKRLDKNLRGILDMGGLPHAVFVVDANREEIAVHEARKLGIPVIGIVDTNCDPDMVDFVIPGNDDALRAIKLFTSRIADAVMAGRDMNKPATPETGATPADGSGGSGPSDASDADEAPAAEASPAATAQSTEAAKPSEPAATPASEDAAPATIPQA
jgi:small subunit ribosomal protein S2